MSARNEFSKKDLLVALERQQHETVRKAEETCREEMDFSKRLETWRTEAEKQVRRLARNLKTVSDYELTQFEIPSAPRKGYRYDPEGDRDRAYHLARERYLKRVARLNAMPGATVSLTPKMLTDLFGL